MSQTRDIDLVNLSNHTVFMYTSDLAYKKLPDELKHYSMSAHENDIRSGKKLNFATDNSSSLNSHVFFKRLLKIFWKYNIHFSLIDVGSQYGSFSIELGVFIKKSDHTNKIYAFDCGMASNLCPENIKLNLLDDIIKFERKAVTNKSIPQKVFFDAEHSEDNHIVQRGDMHFNSYVVDGTTLDDYFREYDEDFIIKIDAQGAEPLIFEGMSSLLMKKPPVFFEFTPWTFEYTSKDPLEFLKSIPSDYAFFEFEPSTDKVYEINRNDLDKFVKSVSESTAKWTDTLILNRTKLWYNDILDEINKSSNFMGSKFR